MYALGDKYDVTILKDSALVSFKELTTMSQSDLLGSVESIPTLFSSTLEICVMRCLRRSKRVLPFFFTGMSRCHLEVLYEVPDFSWGLHQHCIGVA